MKRCEHDGFFLAFGPGISFDDMSWSLLWVPFSYSQVELEGGKPAEKMGKERTWCFCGETKDVCLDGTMSSRWCTHVE